MDTDTTAAPLHARSHSDYHLIDGAGERAQRAGLVNASWYRSPVTRPQMKALMQRDDRRAIIDTLIWYALIAIAAAAFIATWGTPWAVLTFFLYGTLYGGPADSRWHECSHGTAFKTRWLNDALYQMASFQVLRRATVWRWSHARHHTDTLVTGRDPEVAVQLPSDLISILLNVFSLKNSPREIAKLLRNALTGTLNQEERSFIPESEWPKVVREARAWLVVYAAIFASAWYLQSWLPLFLVGPLPSMVGTWLVVFFGLTQHAGLPENVTDHRRNCRTVYMNPIFRFLYWEMNYHIEHHMFPMVPFHALQKLHETIKADCPPPYPSTWAAYKELVPAVLRQAREPGYFVKRPIPEGEPK